MSFFELSTGQKPTGSEAASFASNFMHMPDNTQANAKIKSFEPKEFEGQKSFQVVWELLDGEFRGALVKQSIRPYDSVVNNADRAKEMFVRLYNIFELKPAHSNEPTKNDLMVFAGKKASIKIGNGPIQGVERTWVREVHASGKLEVETGYTPIAVGHPVDSALTRNSGATPLPDDGQDIPF
jgi:hypothetical protein